MKRSTRHRREAPKRRGPKLRKAPAVWRAGALQERLHAAGMTSWQLADLLGVHEHQVDLEELPDLPVRIFYEIARRLDLHPGDIIRGTDDLFDRPRARNPEQDLPGVGHDALQLINALALADRPMLPEEIAQATGWSILRVDNAAAHAFEHPAVGGAVALRCEPSGYLSVGPRLDLLTSTQQTQLVAPHLAENSHRPGRYQHDPLTRDEAEAMLMIWTTGDTDHSEPLQDHALTGLLAAGLVTQLGDFALALSDDVLYSLNLLPDTDHRAPLPPATRP